MGLTITLPENLAKAIAKNAKQAHMSPTQFALNLLEKAMDSDNESYSLNDVVAQIKSLPINPRRMRTPQASLAEALIQVADEAPIDAVAWNKDWVIIEEAIKACDLKDNLLEGR